jgi:hypothetical protein
MFRPGASYRPELDFLKEQIAMADLSSLVDRIDAEFNSATKNVAELQKQRLQEFEQRRIRLEAVEKTLDELRDVWRPRLEALASKFKDRVNVTPTIEASRRQATFEFQSELARIKLRFSAFSDEDVRNLVFRYDLEILPILMQFDSHSELRMPLNSFIDRDTLAAWFDDRIVAFVKTYLEMHQNNFYLKDFLVEDPIAKVRFPKYAAGDKLDWKGETVYFLGEATRQQFEREQAKGATAKVGQ